ncbi:hypothetical protein [Kitasatospora sp. NPDC092286]|uniref:hypothetical protein n=1 Tax=Kitasatospora sp. NPDC092286 TaxID=3364087 RepID=UPI0037F81FFA
MTQATPRRYRRMLAGTGLVALAAGLLTAPAANAATGLTVSDPTASPKPRVESTGAFTDACDSVTAPGWIGLTTDGPTLNAKVVSDTAGTPSARFAVWDRTTGSGTAVYSGLAQAYSGSASLTVPGLVNGHSYSWNVQAVEGDQTTQPTAECHFGLDLAPPTNSVESTDFPPSGSGQSATKYAGETATFTFRGSDPAPATGGAPSGLACYRYTLLSTIGVGWTCDSAGTVRPGADGTASVDLKIPQWGTNILTVQAMDNAGNVSQPVRYDFYAPSDPRPKPIVPGDVDGDGVPDILLPDGAGNLQVISAAATGTTPSSVIPGALAPGAAGWANDRVLHRGWAPVHGAGDDLLVLSAYNPRVIYAYANWSKGDFGDERPSLVWKPSGTDCYDAAGTSITCPEGYTDSWSASDQLVALGSRGDLTEPSWPVLVSVEHGKLWAYYDGFGDYSFAQPIETTGDWSGYDLIAPGPDASGSLTLWARERADGTLHAYPVPKQANGLFDFSALADPAAGVVASGFTVGAYPTLGSSGDGDGDGAPDLWAVTADRHLVTYSGWSAPKDLGVLS